MRVFLFLFFFVKGGKSLFGSSPPPPLLHSTKLPRCQIQKQIQTTREKKTREKKRRKKTHAACDARDASNENTTAATVHHPASAALVAPSSQSPAFTPEHRTSDTAKEVKMEAAETV